MTNEHVAVMTDEAMDYLAVKPNGIYVDATLGGGTHTSEILKLSAPKGRVLSIDMDAVALNLAREKFGGNKRWIPIMGNFRDLTEILKNQKFGQVDGVLMDLGFSTNQLNDQIKGLSFQSDGPLDMRLGEGIDLTAAEIVNSWRREEIEKILREYGEERYARKIADEIVKARKTAKIYRTADLVEIIKRAVPASYERGRINPATRTFQALRIAVNDELNSLRQGLEAAREALQPGGRMVVISFHSLEDRIVKQFFKNNSDLKPITKKPVVAGEEEIKKNPRSRSAKLRAAEKIKNQKHKLCQDSLPCHSQNHTRL